MRLGMIALVVTLTAVLASADDAAPGPKTVAVVKENVTFTVDAAGRFDAAAPVEVAVKTQAYADELEVEECSRGGPVTQGAMLVRFKTEKIDEALKNAERDLAIAKAALATQTEEQARQSAAAAFALQKAEFDARMAAQALDRFEKIDQPLRLAESEHSLQGYRNFLTDQQEELAQLEKMYKADDLTEETEEIVLKRTQRDLERNKKNLEFQTQRSSALKDVELPKQLESLKLEAARSTAERDRLTAVTALKETQAKLELQKSQANVERQEKQLAKLQADREKFNVTAPEAGVAVPGALVRGRWTNVDDVTKQLKKGAKFRVNDTLFTIVKPGAVRVVASVPEASVLALAAGMDAQVMPAAAPEKALAAKVSSVAAVAQGADYEIVLDLGDADPRLLPGYGCKVRITVGSRSAMLVPTASLEGDGFDRSVYVYDGAAAKKQAVRTGASKDSRIEILSGIDEGARVLESPPKQK
jgi:HlyD family secretion protein